LISYKCVPQVMIKYVAYYQLRTYIFTSTPPHIFMQATINWEFCITITWPES